MTRPSRHSMWGAWLSHAELRWAGIALFALLVVYLLCGCAATPDGSRQINVSAEKVAECQQGGGCGLYSKDDLTEIVRAAIQIGAESVLSQLDSNSCRRGST